MEIQNYATLNDGTRVDVKHVHDQRDGGYDEVVFMSSSAPRAVIIKGHEWEDFKAFVDSHLDDST